MRAQGSFLGVLAIAGALLASVAADGARAQPFGRAYGQRMSLFVQVRDEGRHEGRREERGREGGRVEQGERGGYRGQPYAPAPRGYAYPAPAYPAPAYPYAQRGAPPAYAPPPPPAYRYAPAPPGRRNVPLGQAMANIRRVMPGRILDAWTEAGPDGRPTYRVRWAAAGGKRIDFIVDAATGAIIGQSGY